MTVPEVKKRAGVWRLKKDFTGIFLLAEIIKMKWQKPNILIRRYEGGNVNRPL
jgi:hypothetical protein